MSQYPGAGYGPPSMHADVPPPAAQPKRSGVLGMIGLALVGIDLVIVVVSKVLGLGAAVSLSSSSSFEADGRAGPTADQVPGSCFS